MSTAAERDDALVVPRLTADGGSNGSVGLDPYYFGQEPNVALLHQVVTAQRAAARSGTHNTRTRAEARGGGAKPYRQKGTGRARQGSERSPQFVGGGVALGPKPRSYRQRTPKRMVNQALRSALSDRARSGRVVVVDQWDFEVPRTRDALLALDALGVDGRVLVVLGPDDWTAGRSFANLSLVEVTSEAELSAYDVVKCDWVVFTESALPGEPEIVEGPYVPPPEAEDEAEEEVARDDATDEDGGPEREQGAVEGGDAVDELVPDEAEADYAEAGDPAAGDLEAEGLETEGTETEGPDADTEEQGAQGIERGEE